jgi:hypothetical protein
MVPASMFIYGSIFIDVTLRPVVFNRRPVEEARNESSKRHATKHTGNLAYHPPITPFPIPLMTPPDTIINLVISTTVNECKLTALSMSTRFGARQEKKVRG